MLCSRRGWPLPPSTPRRRLRYGPEPYILEMQLKFPPTMPDLAEKVRRGGFGEGGRR